MRAWIFCGVCVVASQPAVCQDAPGGARTYGTMETLLEKSIFKVDVLTLEVRVDDATARRIGDVVAGLDYGNQLADSVAALALRAPRAHATIHFLRDISLDQFLEGIDDDMRRAVEVAWLESDDYDRIRQSLPQWFAFLEERRLLDGDEITYSIYGDTLMTVYRGADGSILLEQTDVGRGARESVLGTYFAPKSSFRKGLIESLFRKSG